MCVCISFPFRRSPEGCAAQSERAVLPVNADTYKALFTPDGNEEPWLTEKG
jgi:hypothetical protein